MNSSLTALTALMIGLASLVVIELLPGTDDEGAVSAPNPPSDNTVPQVSGGAERDIAIILGRPLFSTDRLPAKAERAAGGNASPLDLPRLTGILILASERRAIFEIAGKNRALVLEEGDTIGRWGIQEIDGHGVNLSGPSGSLRITPAFATNASRGPPTSAPSGPVASAPPPTDIPSADPQALEAFYKASLAKQKADRRLQSAPRPGYSVQRPAGN